MSVRDHYLYSCLQGVRIGSHVAGHQTWAPMCGWGKLSVYGYLYWAVNNGLIPRAEAPHVAYKVRP